MGICCKTLVSYLIECTWYIKWNYDRGIFFYMKSFSSAWKYCWRVFFWSSTPLSFMTKATISWLARFLIMFYLKSILFVKWSYNNTFLKCLFLLLRFTCNTHQTSCYLNWFWKGVSCFVLLSIAYTIVEYSYYPLFYNIWLINYKLNHNWQHEK